jgi:hypothetical protein
MSVYNNILIQDDLNYINSLPEVVTARNNLKSSNNKVSFNITLTDSIRSSLSTLGLDLTNKTTIPMRWIIGDTQEHVDSGKSEFTKTFLVFMNTSSGSFDIENESYPITENTAYVFTKGLTHKTQNTTGPRLLLGPMNEFAEPVGIPIGIFYFLNESDATNYNNRLAYGNSYTLGDGIMDGSLIGYPGVGNGWRIETGNGSSSGTYNVGDTLLDDADIINPNSTYYRVYVSPLSPPCFNEGTQILCLNDQLEEVYIPIENLRSGNIVKTYIEGYRRIQYIGKGSLQNNSSEFHCMYKLQKESYSTTTMIDDLIVTGDHAIMIDKAYAYGERVKSMYDKVLVVAKESNKFTKIEDTTMYTYYHFCLENDGFIERTFIVYANGALAETTSELQFSENKLTLI